MGGVLSDGERNSIIKRLRFCAEKYLAVAPRAKQLELQWLDELQRAWLQLPECYDDECPSPAETLQLLAEMEEETRRMKEISISPLKTEN